VVRPGVIDQDPSHHLRRHAEEMRAILPPHALLPYKAKVRLVHERGRLE
jgi:hypothetical protein